MTERNKALQLLSLARKGRNVEAGEAPVTALVRAGAARLILVAQDASARTGRQIRTLAAATPQPVLTVPFTKTDLGLAIGAPDCALLALKDTALALAFVRALDRAEDAELLALLEKRDRRRKERSALHKK